MSLISGNDSNVLAGLNVEESSGSSQVRTELTKLPTQQLGYNILEKLTSISSEIREPTQHQSQSSTFLLNQSGGQFVDSQTGSMDVLKDPRDSLRSIQVFEVPLEASLSKSDLQIELLQQQIEYTKRDIYYRELMILEKERSLSITHEERVRLLESSKALFNKRNTI